MLVETTGKELCELQSRKRAHTRSKKNRKNSKKAMVNVVQKLYDTCKDVFANGGPDIVPSPYHVQKLRALLDGMKLVDVGLTQDMPYFRKLERNGVPFITYLHVYECSKFSIGIFCLPPAGIIPLHNHPGMTVFSKLLFGSIHIKSYDWVTEAPEISKENLKPSLNQPAGTRLAMVNTDAVFTAPCKTSILYPAAGGNMHCFTALTSCAVLDVLGPPYSDPEGRDCIYYRDVPCANFSGDMVVVPVNETEKDARLEEKVKSEKPADESALRCSNVLVCTGDVDENGKTEKPTGESPLRCANVAEGEKNVLLEVKEKPVSESAKYAWLEEKEKPENFWVVGALYRGPRVVKN